MFEGKTTGAGEQHFHMGSEVGLVQSQRFLTLLPEAFTEAEILETDPVAATTPEVDGFQFTDGIPGDDLEAVNTRGKLTLNTAGTPEGKPFTSIDHHLPGGIALRNLEAQGRPLGVELHHPCAESELFDQDAEAFRPVPRHTEADAVTAPFELQFGRSHHRLTVHIEEDLPVDFNGCAGWTAEQGQFPFDIIIRDPDPSFDGFDKGIVHVLGLRDPEPHRRFTVPIHLLVVTGIEQKLLFPVPVLPVKAPLRRFEHQHPLGQQVRADVEGPLRGGLEADQDPSRTTAFFQF